MKPIRLCIDCLHCKTKQGKYYCIFEKFYKNSLAEIMLFVPDDFSCEDWEGDEEEYIDLLSVQL